MARIQYCSDLHLEFPRNRAFLDKNPLEAKADILILAGDIVPFSAMNRLTDFWDELSEKFEHTFWVPGNHEYYHSDIGDRTGEVYEEIRENIFLVNNYVTKIDNVKLIFSTLWTALSETYQFQVQRIMADFKVIQHGKTLLSPAVYNRLHLENLEFLEKAIAGIQADEKVVVSTHHVPTFMNYPEKYRGDFLNEAFAVELFELIADNPIDHWIFGHHHCNTPTFQIGNTDMRTNQ
ncbi:MAG TPA: metallophosphoesterase, partial [Bacteroidetes bacterium]|nr:metallophosphoesterase [Bacteroidota bacterium]